MTPHIAAELWDRRHPGEPGVHGRSWPVADPTKLVVETVTMVVQVNGKLVDRLQVAPDIGDAAAEEAALASKKVQARLSGSPVRKVVVRAPKLVNVVA